MGEKLEKRDKQQEKIKREKLLIPLPGNSSANTLRVNPLWVFNAYKLGRMYILFKDRIFSLLLSFFFLNVVVVREPELICFGMQPWGQGQWSAWRFDATWRLKQGSIWRLPRHRHLVGLVASSVC